MYTYPLCMLPVVLKQALTMIPGDQYYKAAVF